MATVGQLIGEQVSQLRQAAGMTQTELAEAMSRLGFPWRVRQTVGQVESGQRRLELEEVLALAAIFEMPPWFLLAAPYVSPRTEVTVGNATLPGQTYARWWIADSSLNTKPEAATQSATDQVLKGAGLERPWARAWRRGTPADEAFRNAREKTIAKRRAYPGPTYLLTGNSPTTITTHKPPWSMEVRIQLTPGEPYVARDEWEAEELAKAEQRGEVRRITRDEAYRLRRAASDRNRRKR